MSCQLSVDIGSKLLRDKHRIEHGGEVSWNLYAPHRVKEVMYQSNPWAPISPMGQTPGHLTFCPKKMVKCPTMLAADTVKMPHRLELHRASNSPSAPSEQVEIFFFTGLSVLKFVRTVTCTYIC